MLASHYPLRSSLFNVTDECYSRVRHDASYLSAAMHLLFGLKSHMVKLGVFG